MSVGASTPRYISERGDQGYQCGRDPLAGLAPATLRDQAVQDPDQHEGQRCELLGRQRPGIPVGPKRNPERSRALHQQGQQVLDDEALQDPGEQHDQELPQAPKQQQGHQQPPQQHADYRPGAKRIQKPHHRQQPGRPQPGQPPDHRIINDRDRHRRGRPSHPRRPAGTRSSAPRRRPASPPR